jgi:hypothetical protein
MPPGLFAPATPAVERPQDYALDFTATEIGSLCIQTSLNSTTVCRFQFFTDGMKLRDLPSGIGGSLFVLSIITSDILSSADVARAPYRTNDIFLPKKPLQSPKVHYRIHNSPQHSRVLRDINSV